ncbi:MAG: aspartate aminotransferase family protein [Gammaproteobacteria bacterium]|nr:MAG: aspartate aminotransferase family protein [Gammaproteobacteria bacterium]
MSSLIHRSLLSQPTKAVACDGVYIIDSQGKRYLDACGGAAVSNLGHTNQAVIDAIDKQLHSVAYAHSAFFTTQALENLADLLTSLAPGMDKVLFLSGGSEANEAALKLCRQYYVESGEVTKSIFIAREQSYHGNTLGVLGIGGNEWRKKAFKPLLRDSHLISPCYEYRLKAEGESSYDYGQRIANELETKILELGAENVAAFIAETVVGATVGAVPAVKGYFKRIREICDQYDVMLILDEIMCGIGRTGSMFAYELEGIAPDMVTSAKGLGAGYQAIGALLCQDYITDVIRQTSGFFQHGHTFMGHATAVAGSLATLQYIQDNQLMENVNQRGKQLLNCLHSSLDSNPHVGDIRGRGLFIGIELVADKITKEPFPAELKVNKLIKSTAMEDGLMCYPMGGTIDGKQGDHILLAPAFIITESQIEDIARIISLVIEKVTKGL